MAVAKKTAYPLDAISVHKSIAEDEEAITYLFALQRLRECRSERTYPIIMTLRHRIDIGGGAFDIEDLEEHGLVRINHGVNHTGDHSVSITKAGENLVQQLLDMNIERIKQIHHEVGLAVANKPIELRVDTISGDTTLYWYLN